VIDENEANLKGNHMKTAELQKTIFRIGNLLQMSFGQLGAIVIKENSSQGDGNFEIMIPGHRINVIFMVCRINKYVEYTEVLKTHTTEFLNKIVGILHECATRWDGAANKTEGDKYLITWKLPNTENQTDNEKNEWLMEQKTEMADKSLIAAVKIVSEMRRASQFASFYKKSGMHSRFGNTTRPYISFALHMGYTIEGAIGSDFKIDACYLSSNV
jgi:class 3 adenylate cyclase